MTAPTALILACFCSLLPTLRPERPGQHPSRTEPLNSAYAPSLPTVLLVRPPVRPWVFSCLSVTAHSLSEHHHLQTRGGNWKGKYDLGERATSVHSTDAARYSCKQPQGPRKPPLSFSQTFGHLVLPFQAAQGPRPLPGGALICKFQGTRGSSPGALGRPITGSREAHRPHPEVKRARARQEWEGKLFCYFHRKGEAW